MFTRSASKAYSRKPRSLRRVLFALAGAALLAGPAAAQVAVTTQHNDNGRTGANLAETILTPAKVSAATFGKLFSAKVDGEIYAQPLYLSNVTVPGAGVHNVVYVATMNNTIFALDADKGTTLWTANFGAPVRASDVQCCCPDISATVGILGTPVIDPATNTIYFVSRNETNPGTASAVYTQYLNALDVSTGNVKFGPTLITASASGVNFNPKIENQRPALTLANGNIYIAWASHNDCGAYHGWVMSYSASTLAQNAVYMNTPNGGQGGIWMAGQGLTVDTTGNVLFSSGNGSYTTDGVQTGNSFVRLSPTLALQDWFTPYNTDSLNAADADLGASGLLGIPGTTYVVGGGKQGVLYLVNENAMSHFHSGADQVTQEFQAVFGSGSSHIHGTPIYYNSPQNGPSIYVWGENDVLRAYAFNTTTGLFNTTAVAKSAMTAPVMNANGAMPGGFLSVSANGTQTGTGIIWATSPYNANANNAVVQGIIHAFDASTLQELWNDKQNSARDEVGRFAKFNPPTVAGGKLYVPTFGPNGSPSGTGALNVYGLLPAAPPPPPPATGSIAIDCGGGAAGTFIADTDVAGGHADLLNGTVDTSGVTSPAPAAVYLSKRTGTRTAGFTYTIPGLTAGASYTLRLHFMESAVNAVGGRVFNVAVNGATVLPSFDIFKTAGKSFKAVVQQFTVKANASGQIVIAYTPGVAGNPLASGIEVVPASGINFSSGFTAAGLTFNGSAKLVGTALSITDGAMNEAGSAFATAPVNIASFHTSFAMQLTTPGADGLTFTLQGVGPTALGTTGGGLGYGPDPNVAGGVSIGKSAAVKFDLYQNVSEGGNSTGLFTNGAAPSIPSADLSGSGIDLHSGHVFNVAMAYDGTTLSVTETDATTGAVGTQTYPVNIPSLVGGTTAYVGFTGGTGGVTATQNIQTWTFGP